MHIIDLKFLPPQKQQLLAAPGSTLTGPLCWSAGCSPQSPQKAPAKKDTTDGLRNIDIEHTGFFFSWTVNCCQYIY